MSERGVLYATVGILILIFLFQIIALSYLWWIYSQVNTNYEDMNDMIIEIYKLNVVDAREKGRDENLKIPKKSRDVYLKRHKEVCDG